MRTFSKIILMGVVLASFSFAFSTFPRLTDTCASFDDSKKVDVNLTAANRDFNANLIELYDSKIPANKENLRKTTFNIKKNSNSSAADHNSVGKNLSISSNSENDSISDISQAGNGTVKLTTNNSTIDNEICTISPNPLIIPENSSIVFLIPNFSNNFTNCYAPLTVQFTDLSQNANACNWNFRDGTDSTEQNPVQTYSTAGKNKQEPSDGTEEQVRNKDDSETEKVVNKDTGNQVNIDNNQKNKQESIDGTEEQVRNKDDSKDDSETEKVVNKDTGNQVNIDNNQKNKQESSDVKKEQVRNKDDSKDDSETEKVVNKDTGNQVNIDNNQKSKKESSDVKKEQVRNKDDSKDDSETEKVVNKDTGNQVNIDNNQKSKKESSDVKKEQVRNKKDFEKPLT